MGKTTVVEIGEPDMVPEDSGPTKEVPIVVPSQPVIITNVQVRFGTIFWITLRVVLSLFLMMLALVAFVAIVGAIVGANLLQLLHLMG